MTQQAPPGGFEADLVAWGRIITLETRGRVTGTPRRVSVGFVEEASGALLVAATSEMTQWARNLEAEPACAVERAGVRQRFEAVQLRGAEHDHAVGSLILKYGTPSEALGAGPAFRLEPIAAPT